MALVTYQEIHWLTNW